MHKVSIIMAVLLIRQSLAVIYSLNESEYDRMPPLYVLEDFRRCLQEPRGVYCLVDVDLYSDSGSDLMRMIQGYSEYKIKHFNHTQIHRGVCVTTTCQSFLQNYTVRTEEGLRRPLEACLNESLWRNYELQGRIAKIDYCKREDEKREFDISDIIMAAVYLVIILLNIVGSFYDVLNCNGDDKKGNPYLLAFSLKRNWAKLVAPSGVSSEPRLERLKLFHGLRTMTMVCVFFSHTVLVMAAFYVANPRYIETSYEDPVKQILFNGSLVTFTFFVMSSFLLAYNFQLIAEKHAVRWSQWPKGVLLRWLRLTPTYALTLATISTWMRHLGSGPMWDLVVVSEANACRQYWWAHVLYINNYLYDDAFCTPQTWYLAADTQLFCLGLLVCVAARTPRAQKITLGVMFLVSLVITAAHTYFQELDAVVLQSPETYRTLYSLDDTFRLLYTRGHTNLSTYTLGLAGGFLTYHWQTEEKDFHKYKKYRWVMWLLFPLAVAVILSGGLFYADGNRPSTVLRVLYATFYKSVFQSMVVLFIMGCVFKLETVYRSIVEWRGFTWTGRVAYCSFFLHTMFQRGLMGSQLAPVYMSDYYVITILAATIFLSFMGAGALWLVVEAPTVALTKAAFTPRREEGEK